MANTKISIVIPVLNSHEILRRQLVYLSRFVKGDTEIIIVDDGSSPPLHMVKTPERLAVKFVQTNDTRPWTWALARNRGAKEAKGEYLLMYDVDHIITPDALEMIRTFGGQKIQFKREFGVLTEKGELTQDIDILTSYGFPVRRLKTRGLTISPLPNNFAMRRDVFFDIGGYREDLVTRTYPQGEDRLFKKEWYRWEREGHGKVHWERPTIYMFPSGYLCNGDVDHNPFGLFHSLSRKTNRNLKYRKQRVQLV